MSDVYGNRSEPFHCLEDAAISKNGVARWLQIHSHLIFADFPGYRVHSVTKSDINWVTGCKTAL